MVGRLKVGARYRQHKENGGASLPVDDTGMFRSAKGVIAREVVLHLDPEGKQYSQCLKPSSFVEL